jgi:Domain of unknown function (DUF4263)
MLIRVLEIAGAAARSYAERWGRLGIQCVRISYDQALQVIHAPASSQLTFDAIVMRADTLEFTEAQTLFGDVYAFFFDIRDLPPNMAMFDGKKWRSIPIVILKHFFRDHFRREDFDRDERAYLEHDEYATSTVDPHDENNYGADLIREKVTAYRQAVMSDLDNMGFIVRYERGRYTVASAFESREELESRYYFGPADKRRPTLVTVHRDNFGVQVEVEELESLINRPDVSEPELQKFFEAHPHFLSATHTLLPHVRLAKHDGALLIPDFILKPIVAQQRDSRWEVLDLKLPQVKLLAGRGTRAKLSSKVMNAIRQLRDYKEYFEHPDHVREIDALLGHPLKRPKLGVLIGRLANTDTEVLEREQQYLADVKIVTYDEILEQQQSLIGS